MLSSKRYLISHKMGSGTFGDQMFFMKWVDFAVAKPRRLRQDIQQGRTDSFAFLPGGQK